MLHKNLVIGVHDFLPKPIDGPYALDTAANEERTSRRWWKRLLFLLLVLVIMGGAYYGWTLFRNGNKIFDGSLFGAIVEKPVPLKEDVNGRSNIIIFGTSEDDPGHAGGDLTDSIMVISVDQDAKDAFVFSIPRDLWVQYPDGCGTIAGKINAVYTCFKSDVADEEEGEKAGAQALRAAISDIFGLDIHYSVQVNYQVVQEAVNALGGVDIVIESQDTRGILDRNFDWKCRYQCYKVKYANGPVHLDGEQALHLARARGAAGGYGLPRGNFDRDANQRKILIAAREKALSAGVLANPLSVTKLTNSVGNNVRTNFDATEVKTLVGLAQDIQNNKIISLSIDNLDLDLLTTGSGPGGLSIVRPVAGLYEYDDLQDYINTERLKLQAPPGGVDTEDDSEETSE